MNTRIASWLVGLSGLLVGTVQAGDTYFIHADHLGTPQVITDDDDQNPAVVWKADYNPFGEATVTTQTIDNPLRFPGQYHDEETGLHYNYFRDYSPQLGRYLQSDPIGLRGGLNSYAYASGNPVARIDKKGLFDFAWHGNWGGPGWGAGRNMREADLTEADKAVEPVDARDSCYFDHDFCIRDCIRGAGCSGSGQGPAAESLCIANCDWELSGCLRRIPPSDPSYWATDRGRPVPAPVEAAAFGTVVPIYQHLRRGIPLVE